MYADRKYQVSKDRVKIPDTMRIVLRGSQFRKNFDVTQNEADNDTTTIDCLCGKTVWALKKWEDKPEDINRHSPLEYA